MKIISSFLYLLIFIFSVFADNYMNIDNIHSNLIAEYRKQIYPEFKDIIFKLVGTKTKNEISVKQIYVFRSGDKTPFQTLDVEEAISTNNNPEFSVEDVNFDGYMDIHLKAFITKEGDFFHHFWIFDPKKNLFEYNWQMSTFVNPKIDKTKKRIVLEKASGSYYKKEIFKFSGKELVKFIEIKGEPTYKSDYQYKSVQKKWKNKSLVSSTEKLYLTKGKEKILARQIKNIYYQNGETQIVTKQRSSNGDMAIVSREYKKKK